MTDYEFLHEFEKHNPEIKDQLLIDMNNMLKEKMPNFIVSQLRFAKYGIIVKFENGDIGTQRKKNNEICFKYHSKDGFLLKDQGKIEQFGYFSALLDYTKKIIFDLYDDEIEE